GQRALARGALLASRGKRRFLGLWKYFLSNGKNNEPPQGTAAVVILAHGIVYERKFRSVSTCYN
ncbi:MAG: hypothetical protein VW891_02760, partial [Novosphingobium sp.]